MKRSSSNETSDSMIPIDLIIEILSRLPAKSIARFRCVSKLWGSLLHRPYFTELFFTRSRARPSLLFALERAGEWRFYSLPQPHNPFEKSSSFVVAADFQFSGYQNMSIYLSEYASSLIYLSEQAFPVICSPSTGQYAILPRPGSNSRFYRSCSCLGFDPIDKKYKVLSMASPNSDDDRDHKILTLGTGKMMWRKIQCPTIHQPCRASTESGICINGVLYYLAKVETSDMIVCFDVRSEEFKFIGGESIPPKLINYKGKLGGICWGYVYAGGRRNLELRMCVLEDVEKQEWSKHVYTLPENEVFDDCLALVDGVTATGEIVLSLVYRYKVPIYVFYFNPERNTLQTVEIQGFGEYHKAFENCSRVKVFVNYVEDLNFIT